MLYHCNPLARRLCAPVAPAEAVASAGGGATAGLLDAQALARLHDLDPGGRSGLVQRVLKTYTQSLQRLLEQLRAALAAGDSAAVRHAAHTLKSSSASVGALALSALCADVEAQLRRTDAALPAALLERLLAEGDRILGGLQPP